MIVFWTSFVVVEINVTYLFIKGWQNVNKERKVLGRETDIWRTSVFYTNWTISDWKVPNYNEEPVFVYMWLTSVSFLEGIKSTVFVGI